MSKLSKTSQKAQTVQFSFDIRYFETEVNTQELLKSIEDFINKDTTSVLGCDMESISYDDLKISQKCCKCKKTFFMSANSVGECPICHTEYLPCSMCTKCTKNCPFLKQIKRSRTK